MGDLPDSETHHNFYNILGIPRTASLPDIYSKYKSLIVKWHPDKNPTNKAEAEAKIRSINEAYRALSIEKKRQANLSIGDEPKTPDKTDDEFYISSPTLLSRASSPRSISPSPRNLSRNSSQRSRTPTPADCYANFPRTSTRASAPSTPTATSPRDSTPLSKIASSRSTTPIMFSRSGAWKKPQPTVKKLECTLEELLHGCVKKIKITRDVISNPGFIIKEEETLIINVKPGWRKGTKITFEGKGDEKPGTRPADVIFAIVEKKHPMFKRRGNDLEIGVEVPLVQALTGCTFSVPILGGGKMTLSIDDIIYPGYEEIIPGQGMPKFKDEANRGDLRLKFLVEFPTELSDEQRSNVVNILQECS
ncbi:dnaJ homolog 1-like [Olea europaea subsp. europaea]|uniref:DnaJ homolog 1-like n=1 Tax=Olea europaea subsp. europaea TaxID=158383 RepID=A0A8S0R8H3_OLEEU|nr:dnaJ homolog 1-like [Olea europaea subsp. europaea]